MCCPSHTPTVSLGVTYVVAYTYGCDDGRILPTRCAIIDSHYTTACIWPRAPETYPDRDGLWRGGMARVTFVRLSQRQQGGAEPSGPFPASLASFGGLHHTTRSAGSVMIVYHQRRCVETYSRSRL